MYCGLPELINYYSSTEAKVQGGIHMISVFIFLNGWLWFK